MFDPLSYDTKTQETILLGIIHYEELIDWCGDNPDRAYHVLLTFFDRDDVLEKMLSVDAECSYLFSRDVVKGTFALGEEAISKSPMYSHKYAMYMLKGRFVLGEETISKCPIYSCKYAAELLHDRFPIGEEAIARDAYYSYMYAKYVLKGRFELGEKAIMISKYKDRYTEIINQ